MEKKMFALTYCYEGTDMNTPSATTLAVSEDKEKLRQYMVQCAEEDCRLPESDDEEWNDDINYHIWKLYDDELYLQHNKNVNLYTHYKIHEVSVLE